MVKKMNLKNKKVLVVGLGRSGLAAARFLLQQEAKVRITEKGDNAYFRSLAEQLSGLEARIELGRHSKEFTAGIELAVISPGVLPENEVIGWCREKEIPVISELALAGYNISCPLIGITGTNGKSTVTSLINHIFAYSGRRSVACGNLGLPLAEVARERQGRSPATAKLELVVVEVSSFQLQFTESLKFQTALWLNFSHDHQDYHQSMADYFQAKMKIFNRQTDSDWAVVRYDQSAVIDKISNLPMQKVFFGLEPRLGRHFSNAAWVEGEFIRVQINGQREDICSVSSLSLPGLHNVENALAAAAAARIQGVDAAVIRAALKTFQSLAYRFQRIAEIDGVDFINDSKSTNLDSVWAALNSVDGPVVLILGGKDKGEDFSQLITHLGSKVISLVALGQARQRIKRELGGGVPVLEVSSLADSVREAFKSARPGTTVLFSPGGSSFDMFRDYRERGERFNEEVRKLQVQVEKEKVKR